jgi:regulator of sirC expression with transglutaminase-like and TPR domain
MPHRGAELAHFVAGTCYGSMDDRANAEADLNTYLKEAPTGQYAAKVRALLQELQTSR